MSVTTYSCFGETKTVTQWALDPRCVVAPMTFRRRLTNGWSLRAALMNPVEAYRKRFIGEVTPSRTYGNYAMTDPLIMVGHMTPPRGTT